MTRWVWVAIAIALSLPMAQAQLNRPQPIDVDFGFDDPDTDGGLTFVSGRLDAHIAATGEAWGFFEVEGLAIEGITRFCPRMGLVPGDCRAGDFRIEAADGSSVGVRLASASGRLEADHALAFFLRARGDDLQGLLLNESMVAPLVEGRMAFSHVSVPRLPSLGQFDDAAQCSTILGVAVALDAESVLHVYDGATRIGSITRSGGAACFSGASLSVAPFSAFAVAVPFDHSSTATFAPASAAAAREGIELDRITRVQQLLSAASKESREQSSQGVKDNALLDSLSEVLNAAVVRLPVDPANTTLAKVKEELAIILYDSIAIESQEGVLAWNGAAAMQYQKGELAGAQTLYGFWLVQLPWWGWLLWIAAIGVWATRLALRPPTRHERWDRLRWIGWAAGAAVFVLVFILWDIEMRAVWGTSVLTTNNSGTAFWVTLGIQLGTMSLVLGAVAWPLSIIVKNSLLLGRQGTFMGLGKPASLLLAYLVGATLLLAYLELLIQQVVESLPSA